MDHRHDVGDQASDVLAGMLRTIRLTIGWTMFLAGLGGVIWMGVLMFQTFQEPARLAPIIDSWEQVLRGEVVRALPPGPSFEIRIMPEGSVYVALDAHAAAESPDIPEAVAAVDGNTTGTLAALAEPPARVRPPLAEGGTFPIDLWRPGTILLMFCLFAMFFSLLFSIMGTGAQVADMIAKDPAGAAARSRQQTATGGPPGVEPFRNSP